MTGVVISRTTGGDLTIAGQWTPSAAYSLTKFGRPVIEPEIVYADDHPDVDGSVWLHKRRRQSALPLEVLVQSTTAAGLDALVQALDDALWQNAYTATVTPATGVSKVWACDPTVSASASGYESSPMWAQYFDVLTVTIPVYPIPGSA